MPLVTKKNGIKNPKPTAVSFDSSTVTSRPLSASRVTIPATNPPSSTSSPSVPASATSPNTSTTAIRTASWLLDSSVRSSSGQPRHADRTDTTASATAMPTNASRMNVSWTGFWPDRISVTSRIGPNSPAAPAASR